MKSPQLKRPVIGTLATLLVTGALIEALGQESPKSPSRTNTSIVELLQKRRAVLSQLVKLQSEAYRKGEVSIEAMVDAQQELVRLELELATSDDERITLLEQAVQLARDLEKVTTAKYKAAQASQADVLKSQAARLNAEIHLLRERHRVEKN